MAEVSVQLHSCLNTMKNLSREKRDDIIHNQQDILRLKQEYEALGKSIAEKESGLVTATQELETLNVHIKETQQQYKKILDSTQELMKQVKEYNPARGEKAETIIEQTLDDLKKSHQEIQMTNYTIAKNKHVSDAKLSKPVIPVQNDDVNDDEIAPSESTDRRDGGRFSNRLKNMKKDTRGRMPRSNDYPDTPDQSDENIVLMTDE